MGMTDDNNLLINALMGRADDQTNNGMLRRPWFLRTPAQTDPFRAFPDHRPDIPIGAMVPNYTPGERQSDMVRVERPTPMNRLGLGIDSAIQAMTGRPIGAFQRLFSRQPLGVPAPEILPLPPDDFDGLATYNQPMKPWQPK